MLLIGKRSPAVLMRLIKGNHMMLAHRAVPMLRYSYLYQPQYEFRVLSGGGRTRTCDLEGMNLASFLLLHPAIRRATHHSMFHSPELRKENNRTTELAVADLERQDSDLHP